MEAGEYTAIRKQLGLTQSELADRLEVSRPTIARRESGNGKITEEAAIAIRALLSNA